MAVNPRARLDGAVVFIPAREKVELRHLDCIAPGDVVVAWYPWQMHARLVPCPSCGMEIGFRKEGR